MRIVITGANRGIGLELVVQALQRGDVVIATARDVEKAKELTALRKQYQDRLTVLGCDVSDDASVKAFARQISGPVDVLINNAGVMGDTQPLESMDMDDALKTLSVNALGPLRVTRALLPLLRQSSIKKVLHVTSGMGSIADNRSGGDYAYRMSKAALNMASRTLAVDLRGEGIFSAVINPGWVKTDMGGPHAPTPVDVSARGILSQLDAVTLKDSGEFLDAQGKRWPW